jgi:methanogenic corrinoid protein MtbC1
MLTAAGHDRVVILVSGGPFAAETALAKRVGANGVVRSAEGALKLVDKIARDVLSEVS